jgi:hypothetical protein
VSIPSASVAAGPAASDGLLGLGGIADRGPQPLVGGRVPVSYFRVLCVFFWMVRRRRHLEGRIRSSPPYPRSGGAPTASGGRVELCV